MKDIVAVLAMVATWAGACLITRMWPTPGAVTAVAAVAALVITCSLTSGKDGR